MGYSPWGWKKLHMTQQLNKNNNNECNNNKEKQINSLTKSKSGECQEIKAKEVDISLVNW